MSRELDLEDPKTSSMATNFSVLPGSWESDTTRNPKSIRVLTAAYASPEVLEQIRMGRIEGLTPEEIYNATSTRVMQCAPALSFLRRIEDESRRSYGCKPGELTPGELDALLDRVPAIGDGDAEAFVRNSSRFLRGLHRFGVDPLEQAISGALMTVSPGFWALPPFANLQLNTLWTDDANSVAARRSGGHSVVVERVDAAVSQDRHPNGPSGRDAHWHATTYQRNLMMGVAQRQILDMPEYGDLLRAPRPVPAGIEDTLWTRACDASRRYARYAREFPDALLGVVADGEHPLFPRYAELHFCDFAPRGLCQEVERLPEGYPSGGPADSPIEKALRTIVHDMLLYASPQYREFFGRLVQLATELQSAQAIPV